MSDSLYSALLIGVMSLGTAALRFLPFWIFGGKRKVPPVILYLGEVLPGAVLGMLVIYCLRDLNFTAAPYGFNALLSCVAVVLLQLWKHNSLLSIVLGTLLYLLL